MTEGAPTATDAAELYAEARERDWSTFVAGSGAPADHWALWAADSFEWRPEISFFQPVGVDYPDLLDPIRSLLDTLEGMEEIDLPPLGFVHLKCLQVGFLRAEDIMWSQVESFYVNAAPRIHRIEPFDIRVGGISVTDDALYLGVDDGLAFREVRRQIGLGVPKVDQRLRQQGITTPEADNFVPTIPFAYFTGRGDRSNVIAAVEQHREATLGLHHIEKIKMGRVAPDPDIHYPNLDVVAEIHLLGENYRRGYHN